MPNNEIQCHHSKKSRAAPFKRDRTANLEPKNGWFPGAYPKGPAAAGYALLAEQWLVYRFEKERVLLCR